MRYEDVADLLPGLADGTSDADEATAAFVGADLRSQAELARYRRLLRGLAALRSWQVEPPPGMLEAVLAVLAEAPQSRAGASHRRLAIAGATVGAALAGAATAVAVARLRRRAVGLAG